MEKKELLDLIDQDSSFMKAFLDEYRQDGVNFGAEDRLMSLFVDMKQSVVEDQIPESLFDRLANLIRTLEVEKLRTHQNELQKLHNFEKYRDLAENVFVNSFFVSKTFYLLKAIGFTSSNVVLIGANGSGNTTFANSIDVVFQENKKVRHAWREYLDSLNEKSPHFDSSNSFRLDLLSEMAVSLGYKNLKQTEIDRFYSPKYFGSQMSRQEILFQENLRILTRSKSCAESFTDEEYEQHYKELMEQQGE